MKDDTKEMITFLQDQVFALQQKVRKQANEIEGYRVALSKIEEIVNAT